MPEPAQPSQNEILVHLGEHGWLATFRGPLAAEIADLFGVETIPTAFTARAPLAAVIADLSARNPECRVRHWSEVA